MYLRAGLLLKSNGRSLPARRGDIACCSAVKAGSDEKIENLRTVYCDDFKCDSSPQVERTIRSFAKNVELHTKWTITIFAENAEYQVRCTLCRYHGSRRASGNTFTCKVLLPHASAGCPAVVASVPKRDQPDSHTLRQACRPSRNCTGSLIVRQVSPIRYVCYSILCYLCSDFLSLALDWVRLPVNV